MVQIQTSQKSAIVNRPRIDKMAVPLYFCGRTENRETVGSGNRLVKRNGFIARQIGQIFCIGKNCVEISLSHRPQNATVSFLAGGIHNERRKVAAF